MLVLSVCSKQDLEAMCNGSICFLLWCMCFWLYTCSPALVMCCSPALLSQLFCLRSLAILFFCSHSALLFFFSHSALLFFCSHSGPLLFGSHSVLLLSFCSLCQSVSQCVTLCLPSVSLCALRLCCGLASVGSSRST